MFDETEIEQVEQVEEVQEEVQEKPKESNIEVNMRNLREKAEAERKERERWEQEANYYKQQLEAKSKQPEDEPDDLSINDSDFAEGKHLNKVAKEVRQLKKQLQKSKQEIEEERQRAYMREAEIKLIAKFPDAESILTKENLDALARMEPAIANSIKYNPDFYERGVTAITMIKKLGIIPDESYRADADLARRNAAKPRSTNSISPQAGDTPLSHANGFMSGSLSKEMRAKIYKEMEEAIKNG